MRAAYARGVPFVMINTNGKRIAHDDRFLEQLSEVRPSLYFQFDGFDRETYRIIRGEPDILEEKLRALDRLASNSLNVTLVPAIDRGVNDHEVGRIIEFAIQHPAVRGINFQPAFHSGRHMPHDPMQRITIPDILRMIEAQTSDGGYAFSGYYFQYTVYTERAWMVKTDSSGDVQWNKIYGPDVEYSDRYFYSFQQTNDGGFIAAGTTNESIPSIPP